jgi:hypothetical protein
MNFARHALAAWAAACLVAACGGGADALPMPYTTVAAAPAPSHVRIEGCVLDVTDRPLALPVHASAKDGRLLASALTDNDGVFRMHVPVHQHVRLAAATPGAEPLDVMTGDVPLTVTACLRPAVA